MAVAKEISVPLRSRCPCTLQSPGTLQSYPVTVRARLESCRSEIDTNCVPGHCPTELACPPGTPSVCVPEDDHATKSTNVPAAGAPEYSPSSTSARPNAVLSPSE